MVDSSHYMGGESSPFCRTDSSDAPGPGCIWGDLCPRGSLFSSESGPHFGPYLESESTDIPCPGFICEGLDLGVTASRCLLVEVSLLREGSLLLQLLHALVWSISN